MLRFLVDSFHIIVTPQITIKSSAIMQISPFFHLIFAYATGPRHLEIADRQVQTI